MSSERIHATAIVASGAQIPGILHHRTVLHDRPKCCPRRRLQTDLARRPRRAPHSRSQQHHLPFACLGVAPQDLKYTGEPTRCVIGDNNTIREYVTISRGTGGGGGTTLWAQAA